MSQRELHKTAFWVYGVIVGLAVREPLVKVIPHIMKDGLTDWRVQLEVWRFILFLLVAVRFYIGSGLFFEKVHFPSESDSVRSSYPIDFIGGLLHFLLFFSWSVTLVEHESRIRGELSFYLLLLVGVLLYDNIWYIASSSVAASRDMIQPWRDNNNLTFISCLAIYVIARLCDLDKVLSEHLTLYPVFGASLWDLYRMLAPSSTDTPAKTLVSGA